MLARPTSLLVLLAFPVVVEDVNVADGVEVLYDWLQLALLDFNRL